MNFLNCHMARRLLLWACLPMTACIFPQDEDLLDPDPPVHLNRRPRIVSVNPNEIDVLKTGDTCNYCFSFYIEDPDLQDHIYWVAYVDFDPSKETAGALAFSDFDPGNLLNRVAFRPPKLLPGRHNIRAVVGDYRVTDGQVEQKPGPARLPDGGAPDPRYDDVYRWYFDVEPGECSDVPTIPPPCQ